jgi:acetylglutamate kinase
VSAGYVVVKLGGEVVQGEHMAAIAADVAEMRTRGERVVVVHGGGPQATDLQKRLGQTPRVVAGRRITDAETLEVMKMTVAGKVNVDLCSALVAAKTKPVGLHGASSLSVRAVKRPPRVVTGAGPDPIDFGHVGDVVGVNRCSRERASSRWWRAWAPTRRGTCTTSTPTS